MSIQNPIGNVVYPRGLVYYFVDPVRTILHSIQILRKSDLDRSSHQRIMLQPAGLDSA